MGPMAQGSKTYLKWAEDVRDDEYRAKNKLRSLARKERIRREKEEKRIKKCENTIYYD
jgi:hypothetical protein